MGVAHSPSTLFHIHEMNEWQRTTKLSRWKEKHHTFALPLPPNALASSICCWDIISTWEISPLSSPLSYPSHHNNKTTSPCQPLSFFIHTPPYKKLSESYHKEEQRATNQQQHTEYTQKKPNNNNESHTQAPLIGVLPIEHHPPPILRLP